ncbi:MAG: ankyrin repeat domain-containing protein, partial [Pseudomonadota bacterium]
MPSTHDLLSDDVALIARKLEQGLDPNTTVDGDTEGVTLLAVHCFLGHPPIVQQLLQHGADPDRGRGTSDETPLHHVLAGGGGDQYQLQIVNALLAARADPNKACGTGIVTANFMRDVKVRGERPLHRAAAYSSIAVIRTL